MGRPAGQHAARRGPLDPRARGGGRAVDLGGPVARPGVGAAVQRLRHRRARSRGLHARSAARRRQGPAARRGHRRSPARVPRRPTDEVRRGRARAGRPSQCAAVRRTDRHRPDPLGGRATAGDLDRAAARDRAARGSAGARAQVPARLRADHGRGFAKWAGIGSAEGRAAFDALAEEVVRRANAGRRGVDPGQRRAELPGRALRPQRRLGSSRAATPTSCSTASIASFWSPTKTSVASCGPRASGPARCWSGAKSPEPGDERTQSWRSRRGDASPRGTPGRRGGGGIPTAARPEGQIVVRWDD